MKIGVCTTDIKNAAFVKSLGYDFIETSLSGLMQWSEEEFAAALQIIDCAGIKVESVNGFFPGDMEILNPERWGQVRDYCVKALQRASLLGVQVAVMGSGSARRRPEGMDEVEYKQRLFSLLTIMGDEAARFGITITVEPLNSFETNAINLLSECVALIQELNHPSVKVIADFFHMYKGGEGVDMIERTNGTLAHVHIVRGKADRGTPCAEDKQDIEAVNKALRKIGYTGRVSIEAAYKDFEKEIAEAYPLLEVFR